MLTQNEALCHNMIQHNTKGLNMLYFENLENEDEIKARYKELAKMYHPDLGGDVEIMKEINSQYEKVVTGVYQKQGKSITEIDELLIKDAEIRAKMNEILQIEGLTIELCGSWIWVTGETRQYKEKLKEAMFKWSPNKLAWYWREEGKRSYSRKNMNLDEIRYKHGSTAIRFKQKAYIGV